MLYASDLITQYLPWYYVVAQHLRQGRLPHWVEGLYQGGYPLLAEGETGILSPINSLLLWLFPFPLAVNLLYGIYALIGLSGMIYFLRTHKLDRLSSLLGGLIFVLSGFMVSRYFQPSIIFSSALLPWGMWIVNKSIHKNRWLFFLPFIIYLQITAGHLQMAVISAMGYLTYAALLAPKFIIRNSLFIILGFALSAVQLLPSFRLYQLTDRRHWDPMVRFTYSLPPSHLITYLNPAGFGISTPGDNLGFTQFGGSFWEFNLTIWLLPFFLTLIPILFIKRKPISILYSLWIIFLLLSFGGYTPIYRLLARSANFPFRAPSRFLLIPTFAAAALAGFGFSAVVKRLPRLGRLILFVGIMFTVIMQINQQLHDYIITQSSTAIVDLLKNPQALNLATPLPLSQPASLQEFIITFRYGLAISLSSLCLVLFLLLLSLL